MKKVLSILMCIILITSTLFVASATETPTYVSGVVKAEPGMEITVPVSIENNTGLISLRLQITYDEDILELVSVEDTGILNQFTGLEENVEITSPCTLRWSDGLALENNTAEGEIALLNFRVAEDAEVAYTEVKIEHIEGNMLKPDYNLDDIVFENAVQIVELSHTFTSYTSDNNATCTDDGTKTAVCDVCKEATDTVADIGTALGHNLGAFATVKAPDCLNKGQSKAQCSRCDYTETKEIAATGHKDGNKDNKCDVCSAVIDESKETTKPVVTAPTTKPTTAPVAPTTTAPTTKPATEEEKPSEPQVKKPAKVKIKKPKSTKAKQVVVSWKAVKGVKGYQIAYSTNKKFKKKVTKTKLIKKAKTTKTTIKKLKSGKKYFIKIRAYKTVNGQKLYGVYSKVMNVKVK